MKVTATDAALALIARLTAQHGPLMFQSAQPNTPAGCDRRIRGASGRTSDARSSRGTTTLLAALRACARIRRRLLGLASRGCWDARSSGGCCDGSAPMCYPAGDFRLGARDVRCGEVGGAPFYMGGDQHARWAHTDLVLDVVPGRGAGFSLEAPEGVRFLIRSELCAV